MRDAVPLIQRARPGETLAVAELAAEAFHTLDVARWMEADSAQRRWVLIGLFELLAEHALEHGCVDVFDDLAAAAAWLFHDRSLISELPCHAQRLPEPMLGRLRTLENLLELHHPAEPHHHLIFLAVRADRQRRGRGTALLDRYHAILDRDGVAAYVEASSPAAQRLYLRHRYESSPPFHLPAGPALWPMWRPPSPAAGGQQ